jgi:hypothetical protein
MVVDAPEPQDEVLPSQIGVIRFRHGHITTTSTLLALLVLALPVDQAPCDALSDDCRAIMMAETCLASLYARRTVSNILLCVSPDEEAAGTCGIRSRSGRSSALCLLRVHRDGDTTVCNGQRHLYLDARQGLYCDTNGDDG